MEQFQVQGNYFELLFSVLQSFKKKMYIKN